MTRRRRRRMYRQRKLTRRINSILKQPLSAGLSRFGFGVLTFTIEMKTAAWAAYVATLPQELRPNEPDNEAPIDSVDDRVRQLSDAVNLCQDAIEESPRDPVSADGTH